MLLKYISVEGHVCFFKNVSMCQEVNVSPHSPASQDLDNWADLYQLQHRDLSRLWHHNKHSLFSPFWTNTSKCKHHPNPNYCNYIVILVIFFSSYFFFFSFTAFWSTLPVFLFIYCLNLQLSVSSLCAYPICCL